MAEERNQERHMRGKLPVILILCTALVLSLVAVVASNASAQDIPDPTSVQSDWVRLNMPTMEQWQAAPNPGFLIAGSRYCAITLGMGPSLGTADTSAVDGIDGWDRWFCIGYQNNNIYP